MMISAIETTLQTGKLEPLGKFLYGSNHTFLVSVQTESMALQAVYKPQQGEQPLWDFPDGSLAAREVAAFQLCETLGWGLVPATVFRQDGPFGAGSLQVFIEHDPNRHYFNLSAVELPRLTPVALFDLLCNNADRKGSHILFRQSDDQLFAIDHGLCFHAQDKLRTVIWDFVDSPIPANLLADIRRVFGAPAELEAILGEYLTSDEIAALYSRAENLLRDPRFPAPPADKRAYPFPPL